MKTLEKLTGGAGKVSTRSAKPPKTRSRRETRPSTTSYRTSIDVDMDVRREADAQLRRNAARAQGMINQLMQLSRMSVAPDVRPLKTLSSPRCSFRATGALRTSCRGARLAFRPRPGRELQRFRWCASAWIRPGQRCSRGDHCASHGARTSTCRSSFSSVELCTAAALALHLPDARPTAADLGQSLAHCSPPP